MTEADIVVVGGGLAGRLAALTAADAGSASVTLLGHDNWAFDRQSGVVDVLGYTPEREGPIADPFAALSDLPAAHPYRIVGIDEIRAGLAVFDRVVGDAYGGAGTDANALVPTAFGSLRPTARYPRSMAAGLASESRETTLVGFEHLPSYDGPPAAERLESIVPYQVTGTTVQFPTDDRDRVAMAETLDDNPVTADADPAREALAAAIRIYQTGEERIGLPPVLGLRETDAIRNQFQEAFGVPVFEVAADAPSVPGIRLGRRLEAGLDEAGVTVEPDARVETVTTDGNRVERLQLQDGTSIAGREFIVATGGVGSGGIDTNRSTVTESVFGCHVEAPDDRGAWAAGDPLASHQFARFGVEIDDALRPLDSAGSPEFENLRAAGHVLGGFDAPAENSGGGVAVATGSFAGRLAAEEI